MNAVPVLFLERVVSSFDLKKALLFGRTLSGLFGEIVSESYEKGFDHSVVISNGQLRIEAFFNWEGHLIEVTATSRKQPRYTAIIISPGQWEYSTDTVALQKVVNAARGRHVLLDLKSSYISEEIGKCLESIQSALYLKLCAAIKGDVPRIMESLLRKNILNILEIADHVEIDAQTTQMLVDLLKQNQFHKMFVRGNGLHFIKEIIANWSENSEGMVGKEIFCQIAFVDLKFLDEFGFEEDAERDAERFYPFAVHWNNNSKSYVLRSQKGGKLFCIVRERLTYKTAFVFAD